MLQRPTEDSWEMARYSWNNFGITANMSRCPRLESGLIWAFSSSDAVGKAWLSSTEKAMPSLKT